MVDAPGAAVALLHHSLRRDHGSQGLTWPLWDHGFGPFADAVGDVAKQLARVAVQRPRQPKEFNDVDPALPALEQGNKTLIPADPRSKVGLFQPRRVPSLDQHGDQVEMIACENRLRHANPDGWPQRLDAVFPYDDFLFRTMVRRAKGAGPRGRGQNTMKLIALTAAAALAAGLVGSASGASAATSRTYSEIGNISGERVGLSFTTDGTLGNITTKNIIAFSVDASGPVGDFSFDNTDGFLDDGLDYQTITAGLIELTTTIPQPGPENGYLQADSSTGRFGGDYAGFCVGGDCGGTALPFPYSGETVSLYNGRGTQTIAYTPYPGSTVITLGTVSSAPEPSSWALMIAGVAIIGGMLRYRRRRPCMTASVKALLASASIAGTAMIAAAPANATTYTGVQDVGGETVDILITTDGTLGYISSAHILSADINAEGPAGDFDINTNGSYPETIITSYDNFLNATPTALTETISDDGGVFYGVGDYQNDFSFFCVGYNCGINSNVIGESVGLYNYGSGSPVNGEATVTDPLGTIVTLGTVSAAPEPSSWALMIAGVATAGGMLRYRGRKPCTMAAA